MNRSRAADILKRMDSTLYSSDEVDNEFIDTKKPFSLVEYVEFRYDELDELIESLGSQLEGVEYLNDRKVIIRLDGDITNELVESLNEEFINSMKFEIGRKGIYAEIVNTFQE